MDYAIRNYIPIEKRTIALVYYPSALDFYWFVARTVFLLDNTESLPFEEMAYARDVLGQTMRIIGTNTII